MAKKETKTLIPPYAAIAALDEHDQRISMLLNLLPNAIEFMKEVTTSNDEYRDHLVKSIEANISAVMEYRRSEVHVLSQPSLKIE